MVLPKRSVSGGWPALVSIPILKRGSSKFCSGGVFGPLFITNKCDGHRRRLTARRRQWDRPVVQGERCVRRAGWDRKACLANKIKILSGRRPWNPTLAQKTRKNGAPDQPKVNSRGRGPLRLRSG